MQWRRTLLRPCRRRFGNVRRFVTAESKCDVYAYPTMTTSALSVSPLACWLIGLYQRWISPVKGFRCAYRARHGRRASCSQYAKRAIDRFGIAAGMQLLRRRFERCRAACHALRDGRRRDQIRDEAAARKRQDSYHCDPVSGCDPVPTPSADCGPSGFLPTDASCDLGGGGADCGGAGCCDLSP